MLPAYNDVPRRRRNAKDGVFFFGVAADQLVGFANRDAFHDAGEGLQSAQVNFTLITGDTDGGANRARNGVRLEAEAFNALADGAYLLLSGMRLHNNKHGWLPDSRLSLRQGGGRRQILWTRKA